MTVCTIALLSLVPSLASAQETPTPSSSEAGRAFYFTYCASCHEARGEGQINWQKPNDLGELPAPPHDSEGHTWRHSDLDLLKMITNGWRDPFNRTKRLTMPPFKGKLTQQQIIDVISYLKTLWSFEQQQFQREATSSQEMSTSMKPQKPQEKE